MIDIDWGLLFPDRAHRWGMGLRRGDSVAAFFAPGSTAARVLEERRRHLREAPLLYALALPQATDLIDATLGLAESWGVSFADFVEPPSSPVERLVALGGRVEPDVVLLRGDDQGTHRVVAGVVCFPSSWGLADKLGRTMFDVHGPVPGLNEPLARPIETFLTKLEAGVPWLRDNWGLCRDGRLNHHPSIPRRPLDETVTADEVYVRVERQLLVRPSEADGVLFGIRVEPIPLTSLFVDRAAVTGLARALGTMSDEAAHYKGLLRARSRLLSILDGDSSV
jgi:hypothetical protein